MTVQRLELWKGLGGSRLYGTFRDDSDYDVRSIYTLDTRSLLNPYENEQHVIKQNDEEDDVAVELARFFVLAAQCNPNILELLFVPNAPEFTMNIHPAFELVRENRQLFLSKELFFRFTGYMRGQISRLHNHRAFFKNPPKAHPVRADYHVPEYLTNEQLAQIVNFPLRALALEHQEYLADWREYLIEKKKWQVYSVWLKERNPARAALEKAYGYDTKFASHAIRLHSECTELLTHSTITFPLPNAKEVLAIKNGAWTIKQVLEFAEHAYTDLEKVMQASALPRYADKDKLAELYFTILECAWKNS
jgi:hypothetical protein